MKKLISSIALFIFLALIFLSCQEKINLSTNPNVAPSNKPVPPGPAPSPLVTESFGGESQEFWPFTGNNFFGIPQDPINLIFVGESDPRALRAALLFLDGDRTDYGFPDAPPFNFTWSDAMGDVQTAYATSSGWTANPIQLAAGPYGPIRFHLRLFDIGPWSLGGAHFELQIPNTTEHQVLSWELAEQLVTVDFLRSGLLDLAVPLAPTGPINPSPFGEIPAIIYNGLPPELKGLIGGPLGDVTDPVPIPTNGVGTILNLSKSVEGEPLVARQSFPIEFNQVIPKPFCASGPYDFLLVQGTVNFNQIVVFTPSGNFISQFHAQGHLDLTPVDPSTTPPTPIGETYQAVINQIQKGILTDNVSLASSFQMRLEIPPTGPFHGQLLINLKVGPGNSSSYSLEVKCLP